MGFVLYLAVGGILAGIFAKISKTPIETILESKKLEYFLFVLFWPLCIMVFIVFGFIVMSMIMGCTLSGFILNVVKKLGWDITDE